jgi:hypothetical protein
MLNVQFPVSDQVSVKGYLSFMPLYVKVGLGVLVVYLLYLLEKTTSLLSV